MKTSAPWKSAPISRTCEVWLKTPEGNEAGIQCDKPTKHAYPAWSGGYMALCAFHGRQRANHHAGTEKAADLIAKGETWA